MRFWRPALFGLGWATSLLWGATGAVAGPWITPGHMQLRQDIELLAAAGLIEGPLDSWPLPWAQLAQNLDKQSLRPLTPMEKAALRRLRVMSEYALSSSRYEVQVMGSNDPALLRGFTARARQDLDAFARVEHDIGALTIGYGVGYRRHQQGHDTHFEPLYAAYDLGNWALYGGYVDQWWGPGQDQALIFSTSARPFPKVGLKRLSPEPFKLPVLRWLGPWRADVFVGRLTEKRRDYDNPMIIGMRVAFQPVRGVDIGLSRGLQLCGRDRPCSVSTIANALIGVGNADNSGTVNEPGNQLAGFDLTIRHQIGPITARLYGEAIAEDEDNLLIDQFSRMAGLELRGPLGDNGASWSLHVEHANTLAVEIFKGTLYPGSAYSNFIYTQGWTYKQQVIGPSMGGDGKITTLGASVTDAHGWRYYGHAQNVVLNRLERSDSSPSDTREQITVWTAGVEIPSMWGDIYVEGRLQDNDINTPLSSPLRKQIEIGWISRF